MIGFRKPLFAYDFDVDEQIKALRDYRDTAPDRRIPAKDADHLLLASWNIANLGLQRREERHYRLIAEILSWFDLIAVQEVYDDLNGILALSELLPHHRLIFSGTGGNDERGAFLFDERRVSLLEEIGHVWIPPSQLKSIKLPGSTTPFSGFDRGPYLGSFKAGDLRFQLANVHLYYGADDPANIERRMLETFALAWWADRRHRDGDSYVPDVLPLGDFNLPQAIKGDRLHDVLVSKGLVLPEHSSQIGSAIASDNHYDQIAFFPGAAQQRLVEMNVFDYDGAIFADLFQSRPETQFDAYLRYYISDHRPLWAQFRIA